MAEEIEEKDEKKLSKAEKKALKKQQKEEKKKAKQAAKEAGEPVEDDDEGGGIIIALVGLLILAVWLAIFALLIKMDVGGFGSTVLYPVLKDVPVVNKILPETENEIAEKNKKNEAYNFSSVSEAVEKIKDLEAQLKKANEKADDAQSKIADLQSKASELQTYKEKEAEFEALKKKFDKEVVFSDNAPDIKEYKEYYESISPENAQAIYKEVLEQQQESDEIKSYVSAYSAMKPAQAAGIFESMTDNLSLVARILKAMDSDARGKILGAMKADVAAQVTQLMEPK